MLCMEIVVYLEVVNRFRVVLCICVVVFCFFEVCGVWIVVGIILFFMW